jgi:putative ABC transport system permease protein
MLRLLWKEILLRKTNFFLALSAVTVAVGIFIWMASNTEIAKEEARISMLELGYNLLVLPKSMPLDNYYGNPDTLKQFDLPEKYVEQISAVEEVVADRFRAKLEQWEKWRGHFVLLTGLRDELGAAGKKLKKALMPPVPEGEIYLGLQAARQAQVERKEETVELLGRSFKVSKILAEKGTLDDARVYLNLKDLQALLNRPGRINAIEAIGCRCKDGSVLEALRQQLTAHMPDVQVLETTSLAKTREEVRAREERKQEIVFPVVFLMTTVWIGILFFLNVQQRRREIGILRSLGITGVRIAGLFLGKALTLGLLGAGLGLGLGALMMFYLGSHEFRFAKISLAFLPPLLPWAFVAAPAAALLAAALPTLHAVLMEPADALRED